MVAACVALPLAAAPMSQSEAIVRLLNSRSSQSADLYEEAAVRVAADARLGMPLQRYMLAVLQGAEGLPLAACLDEATRTEYLEGSRKRIVQLAENRGNPLALYLMSMENNDVDLLRRAAYGGNVQALNAYGTYLIEKGMGADPADTNLVASLLNEAFVRFSAAASRKDANGLYNLGMCYMEGIGCERNRRLAFENIREAALAGHPDAMGDVALCYEKGVGVQESAAASLRWNMRARAAKGDKAAEEWLKANAIPEDD